MEPETSRIFLATMITAIPTVMTLCLIALFAFPRSQLNWIRKKHLKIYYAVLVIVISLVGYASYVILNNFNSLLILDGLYEYNEILGAYEISDITPIVDSLTHAVRVLIIFPGFILGYLLLLGYLEKKRIDEENENKETKKGKKK